MFEDGEEGDGGEAVGRGAGEQAEEGRGGRVGERFAGAVIDDDPALKPNQPTQSSEAPIMVMTSECGGIGSFG